MCVSGKNPIYSKKGRSLAMAGKKIQITLPEPMLVELERLSQEKGMAKSVLLAMALEQYLKSQRKEKNDE